MIFFLENGTEEEQTFRIIFLMAKIWSEPNEAMLALTKLCVVWRNVRHMSHLKARIGFPTLIIIKNKDYINSILSFNSCTDKTFKNEIAFLPS